MHGNQSNLTQAVNESGMLRPLSELQTCRIRSVLLKVQENWIPYYTKIEFMPAGECPQARTPVEFESLKLVEEQQPTD